MCPDRGDRSGPEAIGERPRRRVGTPDPGPAARRRADRAQRSPAFIGLAGGKALLGLLTLAVLVAVVFSEQDPSFAARQPTNGPRAGVPVSGGLLPFGSEVRGTCQAVDHRTTNLTSGWGVYTIDPARAMPEPGASTTLAPTDFPGFTTPPGLDGFAARSTRPADKTQWQVGAGGRQMPDGPSGDCRSSIAADPPDATVAGTSIVLKRPGPYVYWKFEHRVHWARIRDGAPSPTPQACAGDPAPTSHTPGWSGVPPPGGGDGWHWAVDSFCTRVKWWTFSVLGSLGKCPVSGDTSQWPRSNYINQYAAGQRLGLPSARGTAGGNACGPASLLMAMLLGARSAGRDPGLIAATVASLPSLQRTFDDTMRVRRNHTASLASNDFVGDKAAALLSRLGWADVTLGRLGSDAASVADESTGTALDLSNESALDRALDTQPIVISTAFGPSRWGTTGPGHMIVLLGRAPGNPGEYVVYDPAGNYFSDPDHHYGPASCGHAVLYPRSWVLAYTVGSWFLKLGAPPAHARPPRHAPGRILGPA